MPDYRSNNPMMNKPHMPAHSMDEYIHLIEDIMTTLMEGSILHEISAQHMFKYGYRGFGRLHLYNSECDFEARLCLGKLVVDRLEHIPMVDGNAISKATTYTFGQKDLQAHLAWYYQREKEFSQLLTKAVRMAADYDMAVYEKLCKILASVQDEMFRVKQISERLELGGWAGHDLATVSRLLHVHMSRNKDMDFELS